MTQKPRVPELTGEVIESDPSGPSAADLAALNAEATPDELFESGR